MADKYINEYKYILTPWDTYNSKDNGSLLWTIFTYFKQQPQIIYNNVKEITNFNILDNIINHNHLRLDGIIYTSSNIYSVDIGRITGINRVSFLR